MKKCIKCGKAGEGNFCVYCGGKMEEINDNVEHVVYSQVAEGNKNNLVLWTNILLMSTGIFAVLFSFTDIFVCLSYVFHELFDFIINFDIDYLFEAINCFLQFLGMLSFCLGFMLLPIIKMSKKIDEKYMKYAIFIIAFHYFIYCILRVLNSYYNPLYIIIFTVADLVTGALWLINIVSYCNELSNLPKVSSKNCFIISSVILVIYLISHLSSDYGFNLGTYLAIISLMLFSLSREDYMNGSRLEKITKSKECITANNKENTSEENDSVHEQYVYSNNANTEPEGFIKVWKVIVLGIVTLGIYTFIWIYKTTKLLNKKLPNSQPQSESMQVILSILFFPYIIYWIYKSSKRIEEYSSRVGYANSDLSLIGLILGIFGIWVVAFALMQDQINKNLLVEVGVIKTYVSASDSVNTEKNTSDIAEKADRQKTKITIEDVQLLKELKELMDLGVITEDEFLEKKKQLLNNN